LPIEEYAEHFDPLLPPEEVHPAAAYMLAECPVVHSDLDGGFWVINRHADLMRVMQDQETFASGNRGVRVPHERVVRPPMPPIDSNPPVHRQVRQAMNPFLTPQALARQEHRFRSIIAGLIDQFAERGHCDIATDLAKIFPARTTLEILFGIADPAVLSQVRNWVRRLSYDMFKEDAAVLRAIQDDWSQWCQDFIDTRRSGHRESGHSESGHSESGHGEDLERDLVDALLAVRVEDGRLLTDAEVIGALQILLLGGFSTTADATCNIVIALIEHPWLEQQLRDRPEVIADAVEEIMRLEPPVTARPRRCTRDVEIGGHTIRADDRVLSFYLAANRDPEEFTDPDKLDIFRARNKMMTFGAGPHRCVGSNMARMSLRIMVEELLARVTGIQFAAGQREERVSFNPSAWRAVDSLPVTFRPVSPVTDGGDSDDRGGLR
jgi:cytochrome P450